MIQVESGTNAFIIRRGQQILSPESYWIGDMV